MALSYRLATPDDALQFYRVMFWEHWNNEALKATVMDEWRQLCGSDCCLSLVIEDSELEPGLSIVGVAQVLFVDDAFAEWAKTTMPQYALTHAMGLLPSGKRCLLTREEVRKACRGKGVTGFISRWAVDTNRFSAEYQQGLWQFLYVSFINCVPGYKFKELLISAIGQQALERCGRAGFRLVNDRSGEPPDSLDPMQQREYILSINRDQAAQDECSTLASLGLTYRDSLFNFSPAQIKVLRLAVEHGLTNAEISKELDRALSTIGNTWQAMYARVEECYPALFADTEADSDSRKEEKRRRLITYVKSHPEELRLPL